MTMDCATGVLMFDNGERPIANNLQHHFDAVSKLFEDERAIARTLLKGLCSSTTPNTPSAAPSADRGPQHHKQ